LAKEVAAVKPRAPNDVWGVGAGGGGGAALAKNQDIFIVGEKMIQQGWEEWWKGSMAVYDFWLKGACDSEVLESAWHEFSLSRVSKTQLQNTLGNKNKNNMGNFIQTIISSWSQQPTKIVMVGLDAAGKTTILYKLKLGEVITTARKTMAKKYILQNNTRKNKN
jgi:hypothetical protein